MRLWEGVFKEGLESCGGGAARGGNPDAGPDRKAHSPPILHPVKRSTFHPENHGGAVGGL